MAGSDVRPEPEGAIGDRGTGDGVGGIRRDLAARIDHTLLRADATPDDLKRLCDEARTWGFASVCVNGANVRTCRDLLAGSKVMTVAVVGFPLGAMRSDAKAFEARKAVEDGADEIDMVLPLGALKSGDHAAVLDDIRQVVEAARPHRVKVILETGCLDRAQKVAACQLARQAGAHFVKTSTGFGPGGATVEDIALMREAVGGALEVKASGGIRTTADALAMIAAGASRIGASASVAIVTGASKDAGNRGY
jgi:deoxyribose-phosphate aldolase